MAFSEQEPAYQNLVHLISVRLGLQFTDHRHRTLQAVLEQTLASKGAADLDQLTQRLSRTDDQDPLWQSFVQALTVGETYFYRNQAHVQALMTYILPRLIEARRKSGQRYLRLWSAGCATGEEPYTLAMILRDLIPDIDTWSITLLATDVNADYLKRAREGFYRAHSFRGETPEWLQKRWFVLKDNGFLLRPVIRDMVTFAPLNLIKDNYPSAQNNTLSMDIVLCRNVTIYFSREETQRVVDRFYEALVGGGWLIVGHSEPQPGVYGKYIMHSLENAILYEKQAHPVTETKSDTPSVLYHEPFRLVEVPNTPRQPVVVHIPERVSEAPIPDIWTRAKAAANREDWEEAFRLLHEAEGDNMLQPHIHYLRALIQMQMGDLQGSLASLRQAVYCDPAFALAHYTMGDLHEKTGAVDEAARHWRRARKVLSGLDPQQPLPFTEDLTVEMLNGLLDYRLKLHK